MEDPYIFDQELDIKIPLLFSQYMLISGLPREIKGQNDREQIRYCGAHMG